MLKRAIVFTACFYTLIPLPTSAQDTTTTCNRIGQSVECRSRGQPSFDVKPLDYSSLLGLDDKPNPYELEQRQQLIDIQRERLRQEQRAADRAQADYATRSAVVDKLRAGDCKSAESLALAAGNIELATQARNYCAAPTAP